MRDKIYQQNLTIHEQILYDMGYGDALNGDDPDPYYSDEGAYAKGYEDGEYRSR